MRPLQLSWECPWPGLHWWRRWLGWSTCLPCVSGLLVGRWGGGVLEQANVPLREGLDRPGFDARAGGEPDAPGVQVHGSAQGYAGGSF